MNWDEIEIVIPTVLSVPGRADTLKDLLVQIAEQCPGVLVRVLPQYHRPEDLALHAFRTLSKGLRDFSRPWVILIEDDVELAQDFGVRVPPVLEEELDSVVSFFSIDPNDVKAFTKGIRYYEVLGSFAYSQCVAFRREVIEGWSCRMMDWYNKNKDLAYSTPDLSIKDCCTDMGVSVIVSLPSLVQHRVMQSAFNHYGSAQQQSPTYGLK